MCLDFTTVYRTLFPNNLDFWVLRSAYLHSARPTLKVLVCSGGCPHVGGQVSIQADRGGLGF
jgi:hypothetical protein